VITIGLNKQLDNRVFKDFWDFSVAGADFGAGIKRDHPGIKMENHEEYIEKYYRDHAEILEKNRGELTVALDQAQDKFSKEMGKLFGLDFNQDNYQGYLSIFDCNPRFIETNSFQVFYQRDLEGKLEVVFHESLHFMFFKYCDLKFKKETGNLAKDFGPLWELSEIFNVIVLKEKLFYPQLTEKLTTYQEVWTKTGGDVPTFLAEALKDL